jgi:hypothetical protein
MATCCKRLALAGLILVLHCACFARKIMFLSDSDDGDADTVYKHIHKQQSHHRLPTHITFAALLHLRNVGTRLQRRHAVARSDEGRHERLGVVLR